jgi:hypothetical protein
MAVRNLEMVEIWNRYRDDTDRMYENYLAGVRKPQWYHKAGARIAAEVPFITYPALWAQSLAEGIFGEPTDNFRNHLKVRPRPGSWDEIVGANPKIVPDDRPSRTQFRSASNYYKRSSSGLEPSAILQDGNFDNQSFSVMPRRKKLLPEKKKNKSLKRTVKNEKKKNRQLRSALRSRSTSDFPQRGRGRRGPPRLVRTNRGMPISRIPQVNSRLYVSWGPGRGPGCVTTHFRQKIGNISAQYAEVDPFGGGMVYFRLGNNENVSWQVPLYLTNTFYFPTTITVLCGLFEYYYIRRARLRIMPRVNTESQAVYTIGFAQDPSWPEAHGATISYGGSQVPRVQEMQIGTLESACTNVAYRNCTVPSSHDVTVKYFSAGVGTSTVLNYNNTNSADLRQTIAGAWYINGTVPSDFVESVIADVYLDVSIELCNYTAPISSGVTFQSRRLPPAQEHAPFYINNKKKEVRESKGGVAPPPDEDEDIDIVHRIKDIEDTASLRSVKIKSSSNKSATSDNPKRGYISLNEG